jgi:hypothetical protein
MSHPCVPAVAVSVACTETVVTFPGDTEALEPIKQGQNSRCMFWERRADMFGTWLSCSGRGSERGFELRPWSDEW